MPTRRPFLPTLLLAVPLAVALWLATLAGMMRLDDSAPGAFVPFPPADLLEHLPADTQITDRTSLSLSLRSDTPNLTGKLYAAGAWIVLPAGLQSCIPNAFRRNG